MNGSGQVGGLRQQAEQRGRRKIFPALYGYTETFYVFCSTTLCLLSLLTEWDSEQEKKFLVLYPIISRGCYVAFEFDLHRLFVYQRYFWLIIYYSKFSSIIPLLTLAVQFTVIYLDNINLILQMNRFSV